MRRSTESTKNDELSDQLVPPEGLEVMAPLLPSEPLPPLSEASAALLARLGGLSATLSADLRHGEQKRKATDGKDLDRKPVEMLDNSTPRADDDSIMFLVEMSRMHAASDYKYIFDDFRVRGFTTD